MASNKTSTQSISGSVNSDSEDEGDQPAANTPPLTLPELLSSEESEEFLDVTSRLGKLENMAFDTPVAVINPANANLRHGGGITGALATRLGPAFQLDSDDIVQQGHNLPRALGEVLRAEMHGDPQIGTVYIQR